MAGQLGMSAKLGPVEYMRRFDTLSSETKAMVEAEVKKILEDSYTRTRELLVSKRRELDLLAKALVEYETLDKAEVDKVLRGEKLDDRIPIPPGPMTIPKGPESDEGGIHGLPPLPGSDDGPGVPPPAMPPPPAAAGRDRNL
jgi:ATP-dependent metalloprotease